MLRCRRLYGRNWWSVWFGLLIVLLNSSSSLFSSSSSNSGRSVVLRCLSSGGIASCSYTFLRSVVSLSVCRLSHSCLNRSTDLDAICQVCYTCGVHAVTHCVRCRSLTTHRKGRFWLEPKPKHAIANCCCHLTNRNKQRFRLLQITLVLLLLAQYAPFRVMYARVVSHLLSFEVYF